VWDDQADETKLTAGFGLHGALDIGLGNGWSVGASAGYDWLLDDCDLSVGPNQVTLDLSGYTLSAQVGREL
jgi:hypothetical protein